MADLASSESHPPSSSGPLPSLRRYSAGLGIFLGGIPLCFGAPAVAGGVVALAATLLGIVMLPRLAAAWDAWADAWWFEVAAIALMGLGAAGWVYSILGWTPKPENLIGPVGIGIGMLMKRRLAKKEPNPRPLMKDR